MGCYHSKTREQTELDQAQNVNLAAYLRREQRAEIVGDGEGFPEICEHCDSHVLGMVRQIRMLSCDECRPAVIAKSEIPPRDPVRNQTEPMSPEIRVAFSAPLEVQQMIFKPAVNPWLLFFTALAAVGLGKLFDLAWVAYVFWWTGNWPLTPGN